MFAKLNYGYRSRLTKYSYLFTILTYIRTKENYATLRYQQYPEYDTKKERIKFKLKIHMCILYICNFFPDNYDT